jgi:hypothetical protein
MLAVAAAGAAAIAAASAPFHPANYRIHTNNKDTPK